MALSHCVNNIWIEMETFQLFNKKLGTFLHPSWFLPNSPPHPPQMIDSQGMGAVTVPFFAFLTSFSSFLPHKGENTGKRQWEGVNVLLAASLRKKAFSAGSGGLKRQSRALWKCLPWPPRGAPLIPAPHSPRVPWLSPKVLSGSPPLPHTALCFQLSISSGGERSRTEGRRNRSRQAAWAKQGWVCSSSLQGLSWRAVNRAPARLPPLLEAVLMLLLPVIKIQACYKKNFSFKGLIEMH